MPFVQILEFRTRNIDSVLAMNEEWERKTAGRGTLRRLITMRDRNESDLYRIVAFFDSYESAMRNSRLSETKALADQLRQMVSGEVQYYDMDIVADIEARPVPS
jgi:hypothetical protein